ncbi:hypothetical protein JOC95_001016 [Bacillus tianshenii]|uniref:Pullulanase n=1 Tax=Sutcliffiella tianshenii TaxID=1463404 RepID=A0ABS2NWW8_9BACI|nr:DUF6509 family protein [Bacillus tianshenii]MBM7619167.1 hypothetical protein [Bacillus tianshenii]
MNITGHEAEKLKDPTGILTGERYEFLIDIDIPEDDEMHMENGVFIKAIVAVDDKGTRIVQYHLYEDTTNKLLDFELEEEELEMVKAYCIKLLEQEVI